MPPAPINKDTLDRLLALGRRQGHLTTEDLRRALPIASMEADEIALVVVHLEEAGVNVELDDSLLAGSADPSPVRMDGASILPLSGVTSAPRPPPQPMPAASLPGAAEGRKPAPVTGLNLKAHKAVILALVGLLALGILVILTRIR